MPTVSVKKPARAPTIMAPKTLVAAKPTAKSITEVRMVPSIPVRSTDRISHTQSAAVFLSAVAVTSVTARYAIAIPKATI